MELVRQPPLFLIHLQPSTVQLFCVLQVSDVFTINASLNLDTAIPNQIVKPISFASKINVLIDVLLFGALMDLNVLKDNAFQLPINVDTHMIALQVKNAITKAVVLISVMVYSVLQPIDVSMVNV